MLLLSDGTIAVINNDSILICDLDKLKLLGKISIRCFSALELKNKHYLLCTVNGNRLQIINY